MPDPANPCGEFTTLTTSDDCDLGGRCDDLGKSGPESQCERHKFCVRGPLEIVLEAEAKGFLAAGAGNVVFGWDDQNTGAELDQSGGPKDGAYVLPPAAFGDDMGPNAFRSLLQTSDGESEEIAFECTMAAGLPARLTPTPDASLISFEIETR